MNKQQLAEQLSKFDLEDIKAITADATAQASHRKQHSVPQDLWEDLYRKQQRLERGQKVLYRIDLPIQIVFTVNAEHEYGHVSDFEVEFLKPEEPNDFAGIERLERFKRVFENEFKEMIRWAAFESGSIETLDERLGRAGEEESKAYRAFNNLRWQIEHELKVDPWPVLKQMEDKESSNGR